MGKELEEDQERRKRRIDGDVRDEKRSKSKKKKRQLWRMVGVVNWPWILFWGGLKCDRDILDKKRH